MSMGYLSFLIAFFLVLSRLVNRRMIINGYTPLQAISIIIFSLPLSFFVIKQRTNVCYDDITFAMGSRNSLCEIQGLLLVYGYHLIVLCLVARVLSVFLLVVFKKNIPRVYLTILILGLSSVFAGLASSHIRFNGGSMCWPAHYAMKKLVQIPVLSYSCLGLLLQFSTSWYVTRTMVHVRLSILSSRIPDDLRHRKQHIISWQTKTKVWASCHLKAVLLLWRTYVTSLFLGGVIVFAAAQYLISTTGKTDNNRLATQEWIACVIINTRKSDFDGDLSMCTTYLHGAGTYTRMLVGMILMLGFAIIFLFTELRMFLFKSWYRLLSAGPMALLSRKKSDAILDKIANDELSRVWMPERLQNGFFGRDRSAIDDKNAHSNLDYQILMFKERKQQQERLHELRSFSGSSSSESARTRSPHSEGDDRKKHKPAIATISISHVAADVQLPSKAILSPRPSLGKRPRKVASLPNIIQLRSSPDTGDNSSSGRLSGIQTNWIKSFLSTTEQRQRYKKRRLKKKRMLLQQQRHNSTCTMSSMSSMSSSLSAAISNFASAPSGGTPDSINTPDDSPSLNDIQEEDEQLDFMTFLNNYNPPPRR